MAMIAKRNIYDTHGKLAIGAGEYVKTHETADPDFIIVEATGEPDYEIKVPASFLVAE